MPMTLAKWRESKAADRMAGDRAVRSDPAAIAWHIAQLGRRPGDEIFWDQIEPLDGPPEPAAPASSRRRRPRSGSHA